jgi:hypothetical protein
VGSTLEQNLTRGDKIPYYPVSLLRDRNFEGFAPLLSSRHITEIKRLTGKTLQVSRDSFLLINTF